MLWNVFFVLFELPGCMVCPFVQIQAFPGGSPEVKKGLTAIAGNGRSKFGTWVLQLVMEVVWAVTHGSIPTST